MKGLYYSFFLLRKNYFIYSSLAALVTAIAGCLMITFAEGENMLGFTGMLILFVPLICAMFPIEALCLDLDRTINTRFANYILSGMTPARFVTAELNKNLLSMGVSLAMIGVCDLAFWLTDNSAMSFEVFAMHIIAVLVTSALNWILMPLIVKMKSSDKAGLTLGVTLGVLLIPAMICFDIFDNPDKLIDIFTKPVTLIISIAATAVLYAAGYFIFYKQIKRGDIC